jgi:hypothetical protein
VRRLETAANVAIIITALSVSVLAVDRFMPGRLFPAQPATSPPYAIGEHLDVDGAIDLSRADRTLVVAADTRCQQCTKTLPFIARVLERHAGAIQVVVITRESVPVMEAYLREHGVGLARVVEIPFERFRIRGVPTLVTIDRRSRVVGSWYGAVPENADVPRVLSKLGLSPSS